MTAPSINREQVVTLLGRFRRPDDGSPPEPVVVAWLRRLEGYSLGECEAALVALGPDARTATPTVIAQRIDTAREHRNQSATADGSASPPRQLRWKRETARAHHRDAGWRGIQAVYAAMGWQRDPDADAARTQRCPFCRAAPGELCGPLSRNRAGHREQRDPKTRMHPSRLTAGLTSEMSR